MQKIQFKYILFIAFLLCSSFLCIRNVKAEEIRVTNKECFYIDMAGGIHNWVCESLGNCRRTCDGKCKQLHTNDQYYTCYSPLGASGTGDKKSTVVVTDENGQVINDESGYTANNLSELPEWEIKTGDGIATALGDAFDIATGKISCEELLNTGEGAKSTVLDVLHKVFSIIKIAAFAILLIFTAFDFVGAIAKSDGDAIKSATKNLPKRLIVAFLIFILPSIIELILTAISLNNGSCNF